MDDGTQGLRLWFTIEDPSDPSSNRQPITVIPGQASSPATQQSVILEGEFTLEPFDEAALINQYPADPPQGPFNEYGYYVSAPFSLNAGDIVTILMRSDARICVDNTQPDCNEGLTFMVFRRVAARAIRSIDAQILSDEVNDLGETWEATVVFKAAETGVYQFILVNQTDQVVSCEYLTFKE